MADLKIEPRTYIAIDLKSFYASCECVERKLDPLDANLVVADLSRTEKTICLAVSPSLKAYGIPGRPRLFEVVSKVKQLNQVRQQYFGNALVGKSVLGSVLAKNSGLSIDYIVARPRMQLYMDYSARIVEIYLKYVSAEDLDVYSVDEVFIDATSYLPALGISAYEFTRMLVRDVYETTGITATAGIGTNMYLAKIAMDVEAKHVQPDAQGVRIASLNEHTYRLKLWDHKPITDFWRVGPGIANRLAALNIHTMGDICRVSEGISADYNEDLLYSVLGVNAELLIDHAWGYESATISDVKKLKPQRKSLGVGQVLSCAYPFEKAKLIVWEMAEQLSLDLVSKGYIAAKAVLHITYDVENLKDPQIKKQLAGRIVIDHYGRKMPAGVRGTVSFGCQTSSSEILCLKLTELFARISSPNLSVRKISMAAIELGRLQDAKNKQIENEQGGYQTDLFLDAGIKTEQEILREKKLERELRLQQALISIKKRYGKNAVFRGADLLEGATTLERNGQIGGHKA